MARYTTCKCGRRTRGAMCRPCYRAHLAHVLDEYTAPMLPVTPDVSGEAIVVSDLHIPYHHPPSIAYMCDVAALLDVRTLIIAGDLIHADTLGRFDIITRTPSLADELRACRRILDALCDVFTRVVVIPGNHDQRLERVIANMARSKSGQQALEVLLCLLDRDNSDSDPGDAQSTTHRLLTHLLPPRVEHHPLPALTLNGTWLIQHPGSLSRLAPATERAMSAKWRMSVLQGHSHLFACGFDTSGRDVCMTLGHMSDDDKFRYRFDKPSTFPQTTRGFAAVLQGDGDHRGYVVPMAIHDRWFDMRVLAARLKG